MLYILHGIYVIYDLKNSAPYGKATTKFCLRFYKYKSKHRSSFECVYLFVYIFAYSFIYLYIINLFQ